jgi:hypothetical protein
MEFKMTEEDVERIRQNREKAIAIRAELASKIPIQILEAGRNAVQASSSDFELNVKNDEETNAMVCEQCLVDENICGTPLTKADLQFWKDFGEKCCFECRKQNEDLSLISGDVVKSEYLIPASSLCLMKFVERDNPRNRGWVGMKLYLRKHAREKAVKKWGSSEGLAVELEKRRSRKYKRDLLIASSTFDQKEDTEGVSKCEIPRIKSKRAKFQALTDYILHNK